MSYAEFAPLPALAPFVRCVWVFDAPATAAAATTRIVPDGRPELVIHCGDRFAEVSRDGSTHTQPRILFAGQVTRPLVVKPLGRASVIGVRFHPAGALPFLGRSLRDATDARLPASRLLGRGATTLLYELETMTAAARMQRVQEFVAARIDEGGERDGIVEAAVARIAANQGRVDVATLATDAGIGRRQLERRFGHAVGVGPALLASIFRFRSVFDLIERDVTRPWTDAALAAGYYDQSHFIREFRRFVGVPPTEFTRTAAELAEALARPQADVANVQATETAGR